MIKTINPYTETIINSYEEMNIEQLNQIAYSSYLSFKSWKNKALKEKKELLYNTSAILKTDTGKYAKLITEEMGKPITQSIAEVKKSAWVCEYYADNAEEHLKNINYKTDFKKSYVSYQPIGPVLAIMPWNFPFWQVFRFAAPNLIAGNTGILKHASNTTGSAIAIEEILQKAGFPDDVFRTLIVSSKPILEFIKNDYIKGVTITGSTPVGSKVASAAGKEIKPSVLELGGSDPYIVLEDADMENAATSCAAGRMINSGQSCIAAKRFIINENIYDEFAEKLINRINKEKIGDPMSDETTVGPMARKDLRDELYHQVQNSIESGAKLLLGGNKLNTKGYFFEPTILGNVTPGMPAFDEELFGPVSVLVKFSTDDEAIELANKTEFGLGAAVFSKNIEKAELLAKQIDAGSVFINDFVKSDPRLPFGGVKKSGYGRELSDLGIKEFLNAKTICVK